MFDHLRSFAKIFVTGPQRSGTRICAQMIAHDTDYEYVDELDFGLDSLYQMSGLIASGRPLVIQCPSLCRHIHVLADAESAVVMMRRALDDVVASQRRIGWEGEHTELVRYDRRDGAIAEVKYSFWETTQRDQIRHPFEFEYESLAAHPMWLPRSRRKGFRVDQTRADLETGPLESVLSPRQRPTIISWEDPETGLTVLLRGSRGARVLSGSGRLVWRLCDGSHTRQSIEAILRDSFENGAEHPVASDLDAFLRDLAEGGFLSL